MKIALWVVTETHEQQRLRIFTLILGFPLAKGFPVLMLHIWIGIHVSINCKGKIYMALGQKSWARAQRYISPVWLGGVFTLNIKQEIKQVFTPMNLRFAVFLEAFFFFI